MLEAFKKLLGALGVPENGNEAGDPEMIPCEQALERLFEYLDGELEGETLEQVKRHFEVCRRCYPRLQFEKSFMEAVRTVRGGEEAPPELRNRILQALQEEGMDPR